MSFYPSYYSLDDFSESFLSWKTASGFDSDYPYVPLFFSVGFFMVKLLEEVIGKFCGHEDAEYVAMYEIFVFYFFIVNL